MLWIDCGKPPDKMANSLIRKGKAGLA
ncbi:hypothetical protein CBM2589_B40032 [Cupriavidus taiwanensis]|uniref:Uncharacterized protein n=1 Tax=Cupriavidus taiwanensis TaxID=164546 RepID=A0A976A2Z8_9BURK|nr:hypothetical protein CBM2589_B40032 [Cupriavidus taiwanensis]